MYHLHKWFVIMVKGLLCMPFLSPKGFQIVVIYWIYKCIYWGANVLFIGPDFHVHVSRILFCYLQQCKVLFHMKSRVCINAWFEVWEWEMKFWEWEIWTHGNAWSYEKSEVMKGEIGTSGMKSVIQRNVIPEFLIMGNIELREKKLNLGK